MEERDRERGRGRQTKRDREGGIETEMERGEGGEIVGEMEREEREGKEWERGIEREGERKGRGRVENIDYSQRRR